MKEIEKLLRGISPRSVLDVATGAGGSLAAALELWPDCAGFTGIDVTDRGFDQAAQNLPDDGRFTFRVMDASEMGFPEGSFDAVMMLNSLHHMADPLACLRGMYRVLAPGGLMWIAEMYRDGQRPTQMTHVLFHHWWAKIDTMTGKVHNETFTRKGLLGLLEELRPDGMSVLDEHGDDDQIHAPGMEEHFAKAFESYREKYSGLPDSEELDREGKALLERVREVGFAPASRLNAVIRKNPVPRGS
jgi:ubiquinone/menaquinone biosynthesis C-methylase UbiE